MSTQFGLMIEGLVALLLVLTIGYCMTLNKRLTRLKADEQTLKATISELITATEIAERAIAGLKVTVHECDQGLGQRLKAADAMSAELAGQIAASEGVVERLAQIAAVARPPDLSAGATVAAAQAFAARSRLRASGQAA